RSTDAVVAPMLERHASEAAFLWLLRDAAVTDPHFDLADLAKLDERVEAHVDGLRIAGERAWKVAKAALALGEPGEVFAATAVATHLGELEAIAEILDVAFEKPALLRGMTSGFGWLREDEVRRILPGLLDPQCPPPLHRLGLAACAAHRIDPGSALGF